MKDIFGRDKEVEYIYEPWRKEDEVYSFSYQGECLLIIHAKDDLSVIDFMDKDGNSKTLCFHGSPWNFTNDEERERVRNIIANANRVPNKK